jgi:hypothetical protein
MTDRFEGLLNRIPGYTGYRQKESMRDDDRRMRDEIARELQRCVSDLSGVAGKMAANRQLDAISAVEEATSRLRHIESRVRTSTYGYGGIFSDRNVDAHALTQLRQFDVAFQDRVTPLAAQIADLAGAGAVDASTLATIQTEIDALHRLFDARNDVIETASPSSDPDILSLLEAPRHLTTQQQQLLDIRNGGTGAILGDNVQFTSHIALTSSAGEPVVTMVQLDHGDEWLAVIDDGETVSVWRMTETDGSGRLEAGLSTSASVSGPQGSEANVPATYRVAVTGTGDDARAELQLSVAGNDRAYSGSSVSLLDLQIFSQGS